jgi:hypothetical protein
MEFDHLTSGFQYHLCDNFSKKTLFWPLSQKKPIQSGSERLSTNGWFWAKIWANQNDHKRFSPSPSFSSDFQRPRALEIPESKLENGAWNL